MLQGGRRATVRSPATRRTCPRSTSSTAGPLGRGLAAGGTRLGLLERRPNLRVREQQLDVAVNGVGCRIAQCHDVIIIASTDAAGDHGVGSRLRVPATRLLLGQ